MRIYNVILYACSYFYFVSCNYTFVNTMKTFSFYRGGKNNLLTDLLCITVYGRRENLVNKNSNAIAAAARFLKTQVVKLYGENKEYRIFVHRRRRRRFLSLNQYTQLCYIGSYYCVSRIVEFHQGYIIYPSYRSVGRVQ